MPCDLEKDLLDAYVDGELPAAGVEKVERHIASCEECGAELDALRRLSGGIKAAVSRKAPPAAVMAIRANIEREEMRRRRFVFAYRALAAAAAVVLVAAISLRSYRESEKEEFDRIARMEAPALREDKAAAVEADLKEEPRPRARKEEATGRSTLHWRDEEALAHKVEQWAPMPAPAAAPPESALTPPPAPQRAVAEISLADDARSSEVDLKSAPGRVGGRRTLAKAPSPLKGRRGVEAGAPSAEDFAGSDTAPGTASIDDGAGIPAEGAGRKKRGEAELAIYETILRKAFDAAVQFRYEEAVSAIEQGFAALTDKTLRQRLSIYREIIRSEAELFKTVAGRLSRGEKEAAMNFPNEGALTIAGIETRGVALRRANLQRMIYPWRRLSNYQKLRLFEMCANEKDAGEILALAAVAFHRGMVFEVEKKLAAASNLTPDLKEKVAARRGLFNKLKTLMPPIRARSSRSEEKAE